MEVYLLCLVFADTAFYLVRQYSALVTKLTAFNVTIFHLSNQTFLKIAERQLIVCYSLTAFNVAIKFVNQTHWKIPKRYLIVNMKSKVSRYLAVVTKLIAFNMAIIFVKPDPFLKITRDTRQFVTQHLQQHSLHSMWQFYV